MGEDVVRRERHAHVRNLGQVDHRIDLIENRLHELALTEIAVDHLGDRLVGLSAVDVDDVVPAVHQGPYDVLSDSTAPTGNRHSLLRHVRAPTMMTRLLHIRGPFPPIALSAAGFARVWSAARMCRT